MSLRPMLLLLVLLALSATDAAAARSAPAGNARERAILARMKQQPLILFVAKGGPDSCGPNCDTWIAVEGSIDQEAADRFRAFLDDAALRALPVFFNSTGGNTGQSIKIGA